MSMAPPGQRQRPAGPNDPSTLAKAIASLPALDNDDEVLPPTAADRAPVDTNEYEFEEDDAPAAGQPPAAGTAPAQAAKPASSTAGASGEQPTAPAASPPQAAAPAQTAPVDDPWAETEDVTYEDGDTGESYIVRAPKKYADKVKNGYARRSVMDRNSRYLGEHRKFLEPIITSRQFSDIQPVLELGMRDQDFARYVAAAHARRMAGLPLDLQQQQAIAQAPAPQTPPPSAGAPGEIAQRLRQEAIAKLEGVDDYTRDAIVAAYEPMLATLEAQQRAIDAQNQTARQQQEAQTRRQQQEQADYQLGVAAQRALKEALPDEFHDRTPRESWLQVMSYAESSGMLQRFGRTPATFVLAAQALRNPMGLAGIGRAPATSVAAQSIADVRRQAEATAAQAAQAVGRQTAANPPGGAENPPPAAAPRVPRFVKDKRTGGKRPMSPTEIAKWMETHGGAR